MCSVVQGKVDSVKPIASLTPSPFCEAVALEVVLLSSEDLVILEANKSSDRDPFAATTCVKSCNR